MKINTPKSTPERTSGHALIIEARFYNEIADNLHDGAARVFDAAGVTHDRVAVPGSLEIPAALNMASRSGKYDLFVVSGCVIRGETYHFEIVCNESARGVTDVVISNHLAVGNCVLTVNTLEQAIERADPDQMDKGGDAARAALSMLALKRAWAK